MNPWEQYPAHSTKPWENYATELDTPLPSHQVSREDTFAENVRSAVEEQTGVPGTSVGGEGLGFGERYDFKNSNEFSEIERKFISDHPEGEIISVDVENEGSMLAYRLDKTEDKFSLVNPVGLDTGDFAGLASVAPNIAAGVIAASLTGGSSIPIQMLGFAGAEFGTEMAKFGVESLRGTQDTPLSEGVLEAGGSGVKSGLLVGGISGGAKVVDKVVGHRTGIDDATRELIRIAKKEKIPLSTDRLTKGKIVQRAAQQSRAASDFLPAVDRNSQLQILERIQSLKPNASAQSAGKELRTLMRTELANKEAGILSRTSPVSTGFREAGIRISRGVNAKIRQGRSITNQLYESAKRKLGTDPIFDVSNATKSADDILAGVKAHVVKDGDEEIKTVLKYSSKLREAAKAVKDASTANQTFETTQALRNNLWGLKQASKMTGNTNDERLANALYIELTNSMKAPVNGNSAGASLWRKAAKFNFKKEKEAENFIFRDWVKQQKPHKTAELYARAGNPDALINIKANIGGKSFAKLQSAFEGKLQGSPLDIKKTLDSFKGDKKSLDLLMSPVKQKVYRKIAGDLDKLNSGRVATALSKKYESGFFAVDLIKNKGPEAMKDLIKSVPGGTGSRGHQLLKESFFDRMLMGSLKQDEVGRWFIDPKALKKVIGEYEKAETKGALKVLFSDNPAQLETIKNMERINSIFLKSTSGDAGASLEVASDISGIISGLRGNIPAAAKGAFDLRLRHMIGVFLQSKAGTKFVLGSPTQKASIKAMELKALSNAALVSSGSINELIQSYDEEHNPELQGEQN